MTRHSLTTPALLVLAAAAGSVSPEDAAFFRSDIRPLLSLYCVECHKEGKDADFMTVKDLSQLLYGCSIRDGNKHDIDDLPLLLAGRGAGTIRSGRRLISPKKTPMCNLHRALMERMGVKKDSFGDSTGVLQLA